MFLQNIADGETTNVTDPRGNVNLSPFQKWINVGECLQNVMILAPLSVVFLSNGVRSIYGTKSPLST